MSDQWNHKVIAYNLKTFREESNLSQTELLTKSQYSLRAYTALENGRGNPTVATLIRLAKALKVNPSRLFQLNSIRLTVEFDHFLEFYKKAFERFPATVGIRTTTGLIIWGNQKTNGHLMKQVNFPIDLRSLYQSRPDILGMINLQCILEQRGISQSYILPTISSVEIEPIIIECFQPSSTQNQAAIACGPASMQSPHRIAMMRIISSIVRNYSIQTWSSFFVPGANRLRRLAQQSSIKSSTCSNPSGPSR